MTDDESFEKKYKLVIKLGLKLIYLFIAFTLSPKRYLDNNSQFTSCLKTVVAFFVNKARVAACLCIKKRWFLTIYSGKTSVEIVCVDGRNILLCCSMKQLPLVCVCSHRLPFTNIHFV